MAGSQNMFPSSDETEGFGDTGNTSFESFPKEYLKLFTDVEKVVDRIVQKIKMSTESLTNAQGLVGNQTPGAGRLGLGSFTRGQTATGIGMGAMAVGATAMSMAPSTMAAVTQAITASTYAGYAGMTNMQATRLANSQVNGATSAMGPTLAAATMSSMGILAGTTSSNNVMGQLGGLSALTGMSNQQAAAGMSMANGMNFLRIGVNIRDSQGNLLPPSQIVDRAWTALTRGKQYTQAQVAATFLSPYGAGYQSLQMIAGGDQNLMQILQDGFMARAKTGKPLTNANGSSVFNSAQSTLSAIGVDKSSPLYSNFNNNNAQAKLLGATEQGLVGGYNTALNANASLTNGFADIAQAASGVTQALMGLKGFLETFPQSGSVGGTIGGLASGAASLGGQALLNRSLKKSLTSILKPVESQIGPLLANGAFSSAERGAGSAISSKLWSGLKSLLGFGETALLDTAEAGAVIGGPSDHGSMGHGGIGGPSGAHSNILPVPTGTAVTSPYGQRGGTSKTKGFHPGIDFGVKTGTNIYAHDSGTVSLIGNGGGYGNYIEIDHGSYKTRYAHLSSIMVSRGQKVSGGQVIGKSGATGNVTGPHLHFEVLVNGKKVNPAPYLVGAGSSSARSSSASSITRGVPGNLDLSSMSNTDVNSVLNSFTNGGSYNNLSSLYGASGAKNLSSNSSMSFIKGQLQATSGVILGTGSQQAWARTLLSKLGKPITPANISALTTWAAWEGGQWHNSAHYNPLNTTEGAPGATNMNREGVKSYTSWNQGYAATVATLNNGRYKNILAALSAGNNSGAVLKAVDHSPWGTRIPGYGGPTGDLGTAGVSDHIPTYSSGRGGPIVSGGSGSPVNVNFNVKFYAQQASVTDAKRFIKMIEDEAKKSSLLKTIGSIG